MRLTISGCKIFNPDDYSSEKLHKIIGLNVARCRQEKGLSQLDLALAIGLKSSGLISVAEIYHNKKHFNIEHLYKISKVLEVDIGEFFKASVHTSIS